MKLRLFVLLMAVTIAIDLALIAFLVRAHRGTTTLRRYDAQLLFESGAMAGAASVLRFQTQQHRLPTDSELICDVWNWRTNHLSIR